MIGLVVGLVFAIVCVAAALWLYGAARQRQEREDVLLRLRAMGAAPTEARRLRMRASDVRNPLSRWALHQFWRAGIQLEPARLRLACLVLFVAALLLAVLLGISMMLLILMIAGLALHLFLGRRAAARRNDILEQLPDFLDQILRALSAGNSLEDALAESARDARNPVREVFLTISRQVRLGAPVEEALSRQADIHEISDLHVLAMAASVNRQYGGSLRRIVKSLVHAIRSRDSAARELRALTAETRLSATALVAITVGLTLYVWTQNPDYYAEMWAGFGTRLMLLVSVLLQASGIAIIYSMVRSSWGTD